jgi:addiction module RelB/DinJ family antitoxin
MKTVINIKADKETKEQAFKIAGEMGLPLSTIVNAFLKQFIREKSVTFEVPLIPNAKTARILRQAEKDIKAGKNLSPSFHTAEDAVKWLRSKNKKWT